MPIHGYLVVWEPLVAAVQKWICSFCWSTSILWARALSSSFCPRGTMRDAPKAVEKLLDLQNSLSPMQIAQLAGWKISIGDLIGSSWGKIAVDGTTWRKQTIDESMNDRQLPLRKLVGGCLVPPSAMGTTKTGKSVVRLCHRLWPWLKYPIQSCSWFRFDDKSSRVSLFQQWWFWLWLSGFVCAFGSTFQEVHALCSLCPHYCLGPCALVCDADSLSWSELVAVPRDGVLIKMERFFSRVQKIQTVVSLIRQDHHTTAVNWLVGDGCVSWHWQIALKLFQNISCAGGQ